MKKITIGILMMVLYLGVFISTSQAQQYYPTQATIEVEEKSDGLLEALKRENLTEQERLDLLARLSDVQVRELLISQLQDIENNKVDSDFEYIPRYSMYRIEHAFYIYKEGMLFSFSKIPELPRLFPLYIKKLFPDNLNKIKKIKTITICVLILLLAFLAERYYLRKTKNVRLELIEQQVETFIDKLIHVLSRMLLSLLGVAIFAVVSITLFLFLTQNEDEPLKIALTYYIFGIVFIRIVTIVSLLLFSPKILKFRLIPLQCSDAVKVHNINVFFAWYIGIVLLTENIIKELQVDQLLAAVYGPFFGALFMLLMIAATIYLRNAFKRLILSQKKPGIFNRFMANNWHWLVSLLMVVIYIVSTAVIQLQNRPVLFQALGSLFIVISIPFFNAAIKQIALDMFKPREIIKEEVIEDDLDFLSIEEEETPRIQVVETPVNKQPDKLGNVVSNISSILLVIASIYIIGQIWNFDIDRYLRATIVGEFFDRIIDISMFVAIIYIIWGVASHYMDPYLPKENHGSSPLDGDGGGKGESRISTLMPLFKKTLFFFLATTTIFVVLSKLGVDIKPLLAGAGIIGLAIGFGAQTLVKDIISGVFYLVDDAFRKKEYIDINGGEVRGTVERISIRSFQLRHHNGPLHTVPYGEIQTLTNYSRDWAIMKFELRVPYETNVEMVRKLIKKIGQELLLDPEFGPLMLEPLKSQGVNRMDDSAFIIRCKFTAIPGQQWVLRRVAYAMIQKAFAEHDIQFAPKRVVVETYDSKDSSVAVAGAAASIDKDKSIDNDSNTNSQ